MALEISIPVDPDASTLDFLGFVAQLINLTKPAVIVEAGTFAGSFTAVAASVLKHRIGKGHIWSADPYDYGADKLIQAGELTPWCTLCRMPFREMLDTLIGHKSVDLAFIDSGPARGNTTAHNVRYLDYDAVLPYMKRGGLIVVDDTQEGASWTGLDAIRRAGVNLMHTRGFSLIGV